MKLIVFALLSAALSVVSVASEKVDHAIFSNELSSLGLASSLLYLEDPESKLDLNAIQSLEKGRWQPLEGNGVKDANFGFTDSSYWFRFSLENTTAQRLDLLVHLDYALLDEIDLYSLQGRQIIEEFHLGDLKPFHQRPVDYPTFLFPIELSPGESKQIYLRAASSGPLQVPLSVWKETAFWDEKQGYIFAYGAFLSALIVMSAYNLCLFFIVKARSYLLYSVFILCMAGVHGSLDGFTYQWFWPTLNDWHQVSPLFFILTGLLFTVLFTRSVLPIPQKSKLNVVVNALTYIALGCAICAVFLPYRLAAMLAGFDTVMVMGGVCITCIAMLWHSPRVARFYCAAWGIYFFGIILKSFSKLGYIPHSLLSENAGNIGGVVGVVLISLALADRINSEKRAKENAQKQSIGNLKRFENLYQKAVEGIFSFDLQGKLISANPAFMSILSLSHNDELETQEPGSNVRNLVPKVLHSLVNRVSQEGELLNHEVEIIRSSGNSIWVSVSARLSRDELLGAEVVEGTIIDISDRKTFEEKLMHLASHDSLTGFYNRRAFEDRAKEKLLAVQNYKESCCLLYLDLDQFKIVNDLCGHTAGDVLLKNLSQRLIGDLRAIGDEHVIARLGGDEFGILLADTKLDEAQAIAEKLRESVERFLFVWEGNRYSLGVSIGLVEVCPFHHSVEQLLVMADTACYKAKDQGRNRVYVFIETDKELQFRQLEMQWVSTIKEAIKEDHFFLVFQKIASNATDSDEHFHYEILLRLMNKQGNLCAPGQFLPAAERYNLMPNIDRWVIEYYFRWLEDTPEHVSNLGSASINLSTQSIGDEAFLSFLIEAFKKYQIAPEKICFEITESMAISNLDNTHSFITRMKKLGCRFSLDDFGTGFSSYAYLKELNVDYLKIDGVFIRNLAEDSVNAAMVKSISDVAKAMGIETVAEFVETEEIRQKLIEIGITYSQGYHIHKPVKLDPNEFVQMNKLNS